MYRGHEDGLRLQDLGCWRLEWSLGVTRYLRSCLKGQYAQTVRTLRVLIFFSTLGPRYIICLNYFSIWVHEPLGWWILGSQSSPGPWLWIQDSRLSGAIFELRLSLVGGLRFRVFRD